MPNVNLTVYLSDELFVHYVKDKENINAKARELVKNEVARIKEEEQPSPKEAVKATEEDASNEN